MAEIQILTAAALAADLSRRAAARRRYRHAARTGHAERRRVGRRFRPPRCRLSRGSRRTRRCPAPPALDLSVSHGELGDATGNTSVEVYLTSHSATACWLDGYPAIAGVTADGTVTPLRARHGSFPGSPGPSANIKPGQTAAIYISGGDSCALALNRLG